MVCRWFLGLQQVVKTGICLKLDIMSLRGVWDRSGQVDQEDRTCRSAAVEYFPPNCEMSTKQIAVACDDVERLNWLGEQEVLAAPPPASLLLVTGFVFVAGFPIAIRGVTLLT